MARRKIAGSTTKAPQGPRKPWAFLVYIAGDNNLSDYGLIDISEMQESGASPRVHVGVEIDTLGEHTGSIRYEITEPDWTGKSYRTVISRLPERDTGDPQVLRKFLNWGKRRYRADRTVAVVWNHGAGFRSQRRDIGYDDFGSSLDMNEIIAAMAGAGIGKKSKLAVLGFDACLMNMLEIAHHLRDHVEVLVGSQQTEPGDGWPYKEVLTEIKASGSAAELGKAIVDVYIDDYQDKGIVNVTQSAIDLGKTQQAAEAVGAFGQMLAGRLRDHASTVRQVRLDTQTYEFADYVDGIDFARRIQQAIPDSALRQAAGRAIAAVNACVLHKKHYGSAVRNSNGLSLWFPAQEGLFLQYRAKYVALDFATAARGWVSFLDAYHLQRGVERRVVRERVGERSGAA